MSSLVIVFRTQSDIEATVVRSLLDAHGIQAMLSSDIPHAVLPLTINGLGEVRIAVPAADADEARRVIAGHRTDVRNDRSDPSDEEWDAFQRKLGYRFRDRALIERAVTHTSRAHEEMSAGAGDNESLEFLGDAILGFVVADSLFRELPQCTEGEKSKIKAALVSTSTLARLGERLALGDHLLLGRGEEKTGGRRKQALIADGYEAVIAAIYLDGGIDAARAFIAREFADLMDEVRRREFVTRDYKSALQEHLQSLDRPLPEYRVTGEFGPDHHKRFRVEVWVGGAAVAAAEGHSKKEAEQEAARLALEAIRGADKGDA